MADAVTVATRGADSTQQPSPLQQLKRACADIRTLLQSMHEQRVNARAQRQALDKAQVKAQRWQVLVLLRAIKAGLRDTFLAVDAWKTRVQEQKDVVEAHQLKLQNLLYEKDHLLREILRCRGFSTKEMDKIEFEGAKLPFAVDAETHRQHLDQLTQELETRKRMIAQLKQLKTRIEQIDAATATKQMFLDGLRHEVAAIETASLGLQRVMGAPVTAQLSREHDAQALPTPLYALFCELEAYASASDSTQSMRLAVVDARAVVAPATGRSSSSTDRHTKRSFPTALTNGAAAASDADKEPKRLKGASRSPSIAPTIQPVVDAAARVPPSRSPSVLRAGVATTVLPAALESGEVVATGTAEKLLALRPYEALSSRTDAADRDGNGSEDSEDRSIAGIGGSERADLWIPSDRALQLTLTLAIEGERPDASVASATFTLVFQYLPVAKVVTAELVAVQPPAAVTHHHSTLMNLFPGDDGLAVPRLASNYEFDGAATSDELAFPRDAAGRPYYWAQWICGLHPLKRPQESSSDDSPRRPEPSVRSVMQQLVKRLVARVHLTRQLELLHTAAAPALVVHSSVRAQFPGAVQTLVESWKEIAAPAHDVFALFRDHAAQSQCHLPTTGCRYFRVTFRHQRVKMAALVEVAPEYPVRAPRFLFQPKTVAGVRTESSNSSSHVAVYENQLKEIEVEVNAFYNELVTRESEAFVLMHQLRKVQLCCDVLNNALADGSAPTLCFGRERRGKDRRQAIVVDPASKELRHR